MISLYQRNSGIANSLAFLSPNVCGQLGVIYLALRAGTLPTSITDTNNNSWVLANSTITNVGSDAFYVCLSLVAGANTITVNGAGSVPNLILTEFTAPTGIQTLNPPLNINANFNTLSSYFNTTSSFQHVLLVGIFNNNGDLTWSISSGASIIDQTHDTTNHNTSCLGFISSTVPFNTITFTPSVSLVDAFIAGLVLNG